MLGTKIPANVWLGDGNKLQWYVSEGDIWQLESAVEGVDLFTYK